MEKIIGITMLVIFFVGLFWVIAKFTSLLEAIIVFSISIVMTAFVVFATYLITS